MAVFATHVVLTRDFQAVSFAPGDALPAWADGLVGSHCLVPDSDEVDAIDSGADDEPEDENRAEPNPGPEDSESAPDFTGATPVRRGRPRKQ